MKKTYKIEVDCALCANKIQEALTKIEQIKDVNVNFMTQKMVIDIEDGLFDKTLKRAIKIAKKIEPDFAIIE